MNLIGNAVKFTDSGEVSVSLEITHGSTLNTSQSLFIVKDSGVGIGQEVNASHLGSMAFLQGLSLSMKLMAGLIRRDRPAAEVMPILRAEETKWGALFADTGRTTQTGAAYMVYGSNASTCATYKTWTRWGDAPKREVG